VVIGGVVATAGSVFDVGGRICRAGDAVGASVRTATGDVGASVRTATGDVGAPD
jgi:hypothetical protein